MYFIPLLKQGQICGISYETKHELLFLSGIYVCLPYIKSIYAAFHYEQIGKDVIKKNVYNNKFLDENKYRFICTRPIYSHGLSQNSQRFIYLWIFKLSLSGSGDPKDSSRQTRSWTTLLSLPSKPRLKAKSLFGQDKFLVEVKVSWHQTK